MKNIIIAFASLFSISCLHSQDFNTTYRDKYGNVILKSETRTKKKPIAKGGIPQAGQGIGMAQVFDTPPIRSRIGYNTELLMAIAKARKQRRLEIEENLQMGLWLYDSAVVCMKSNLYIDALFMLEDAYAYCIDGAADNKTMGWILLHMAFCHAVTDNSESAHQNIGIAKRKLVGDKNAYYAIGEIYEQTNNLKLAIRWFKRVIELDNKHQKSYKKIIKNYEVLEDNEEAERWKKKHAKIMR